MNLAATKSTATLPILVRLTQESYKNESEVFVDVIRMQAALSYTDANRALHESPRCDEEVDRLGYHTVFCLSMRRYIHDAVVNELRND